MREPDEIRVSRDLMVRLRDAADTIPGDLSAEIDRWLWINACLPQVIVVETWDHLMNRVPAEQAVLHG